MRIFLLLCLCMAGCSQGHDDKIGQLERRVKLLEQFQHDAHGSYTNAIWGMNIRFETLTNALMTSLSEYNRAIAQITVSTIHEEVTRQLAEKGIK